jgi:hypothetical protein
MINTKNILKHSIPSNEMNEKLTELYSSVMPELAKCIPALNAQRTENLICFPYLLSVEDAYANNERRIMVAGKETFSWGGEFTEKGVYSPDISQSQLQSLYDLFVNAPEGKASGYSSPYWDFIRTIDSIAQSQRARLIVNNLAKIGYVGTNGFDPTVLPLFDGVFKEEIRITDPQLILLMVSSDYDPLIRESLGDFTQESVIPDVTSKQCARLIFPEENTVLAGKTVIRTYHPSYLRRMGYQDWAKTVVAYLEELVKTFFSD